MSIVRKYAESLGILVLDMLDKGGVCSRHLHLLRKLRLQFGKGRTREAERLEMNMSTERVVSDVLASDVSLTDCESALNSAGFAVANSQLTDAASRNANASVCERFVSNRRNARWRSPVAPPPTDRQDVNL